jgi:hypothetical protein
VVQSEHSPIYPGDMGGSGSSTPDPDSGKDLGYLVPTVTVAWNSIPSFNDPPPGASSSGSGGDSTDVPAVPPIKVDLTAMRGTEESMLSACRAATSAYENLAHRTLSVKDTIFGQDHVDDGYSQADIVVGQVLETAGEPDSVTQGLRPKPADPIGQMGKEFAASMNPAMEKVLWMMGNSLELVGEYIAAINSTGQTYSEIDRESKFPVDSIGKPVVVFDPSTIHYGHGVPPRG